MTEEAEGGIALGTVVTEMEGVKSTNEVRKMIRLKDIIIEEGYEVKGRTIKTNLLQTLFEKLMPVLPKEKQNEIAKQFTKLLEGATKVNEMRYSAFNLSEYDSVYREAVSAPAEELRKCLAEVLKDRTETEEPAYPLRDLGTLVEATIKALDEVFITQ